MIKPVKYDVSIRVSNDEHHAIYIEDFEDFEDTLVQACLENIGCYVEFKVRFFPVFDWNKAEEDGRDLRTDDDESE